MSYLDRLAQRASGDAPQVRPRGRSRFELSRGAEEPALPLPEENAAVSLPPQAAASASDGIVAAQAETTTQHAHRRSTSPKAAGVARIELARGAKPQEAFARDAEPPAAPISLSTTLTHLVSPLSSAEPPAAWEDNERARSALPPSFEPPLAPGRTIGAVRDGSLPPARGRKSANERHSAASPGARHVRVTIGRVEVRAVPAASAPRQPAPDRRPVALSLEDYLRKRGEP